MISRSLSRRLERLETSVMPTSQPVAITIQFVSAEKVVTGSMSIEVDLPALPVKKQGRR